MYFPVIYSTLNERALKEYIQENYEINDILFCRLLVRGMNDTYLIKTKDNKFVFRVYRTPWRSNSSEVGFEIDLINYLFKNGVPVSYPIQALNSEYIQRFNVPEGIRYGILFSFAEGEALTIESEEEGYNYGKAVAAIHLESVEFDTEHDRPVLDTKHLIEEPLEIIKKNLNHRIADYNFFNSIGKKLINRIMEMQNDLDWGICHGDLHGGNAHIRADIITHFDFDICGYGWRAYDLAVFKFAREIEIKNNQEKKDDVNRIWNAFLAGYESIRKLSQSDIESIPYFCCIRQLWLMKLTLQYFRDLDIVGSVNAEEEYFNEEIELLKRMISGLGI